ncbi:MAG TPA: hypothetical protein VNX68_01730 [Nitrosopumilaceae archaeon]|nr:hypothetical protein [Nitrosopumilaceae archaeon]
MLDPPDTMKALTTIVIGKTLLDIGKPVYDKVASRLYEKYHCYIPDCFEKPEYLKEVLEELYGASHKVIVYSIQEQLSEFAYKKKTETFLTVLLK